MLLIGMPLAIVLGTIAALGLFPGWSLWQAALLAAILTPTDAALGQSVIESETIPERIRTGLGSESGLNDGLALPLVLLFAALAAGRPDNGAGYWLQFVGSQILLGPLAGIAVGYAGGRLVALADQRGWMSEWAEGVAAMAIAAGAFMLAEAVHGNGVLAARAVVATRAATKPELKREPDAPGADAEERRRASGLRQRPQGLERRLSFRRSKSRLSDVIKALNNQLCRCKAHAGQ